MPFQLPDRVTEELSKRYAGHTFNQETFDNLKGEDGCISKEDHAKHIMGPPAKKVELSQKMIAHNSKKQLLAESTCNSGVVFSFRDVTFSVIDKKTKNTKTIVHGVSGCITPGHVLAIMGPSGAGKTTLINSLALLAFGGRTTGAVRLGDQPMTPGLFREHCYIVNQQDFHWPFLTVREAMTYAAELYRGQSTPEEQAEIVEHIITKMGLESCADTIAGNEFVLGLSGGQRRRLSIGLSLIKEPLVLFMDEPTSGLDAAAAASIMQFITKLAEEEKIIVVATIHQPSTKVYEGFDQIMILSGGKEAYRGKAADGVNYFASIGHPMPEHTNPAEFYLDLVNADFLPQAEVDAIIRAWKHHSEESGMITQPRTEQPIPSEDQLASFIQQVSVMFKRHSKLVYKDPVTFLGRSIMFLIANLYFAVVYIKARDRDQDQVLNRFWTIIWFVCVPTQLSVIAVYSYSAEFNSVKKEIKNGMIDPLAFLIAKIGIELPIMVVFFLFAMGIPGFGVMDYDAANFLPILAIYAVQMYVWEAMAQFFSTLSANPLFGMMLIMFMWFNGFLYAGFLIPADDMIWPLKIFYYILPMKYGIRSLTYYEYIDSRYAKCPNNSHEICYGRDGKDVLKTMHEIYGTANSNNTFVEDFFVSIAIAFVFKAAYIYMFLKTSKASSSVHTAKDLKMKRKSSDS